MMNRIAKLFNMTPSAKDIRLQLKEIERDQRKKRRDLDILEQTKQQKVKQAVAAKKAGNQELLKDIFREMKQVEIDTGHVHEDLRRISLAKTALNAFLRKVESLEKKKDRKSLQTLISRFSDSSLQKVIDSASVDDDTFNDMLEDILGDEELSATRGKGKEDVGFAAFDRAIGEMAKAEESGAVDEEPVKLPEESRPPAVKSPDNYPSYGNKPKAKGPDNYPSYGDKPQALEDLIREPIEPVFPGSVEADADAEAPAPKPSPSPSPSPTPSPDPCADFCTGALAPRDRVHG
jgi:hypothetical protein